MHYAILGPLRLGPHADGALPPKEAKLLAALLVRAGQPVSTDTLIDVLWPAHVPPTAHTSLQVHVSQLRKRIGAARVVTKAQSYALELEADVVDAHRFREAVLAASQAAHQGRHPGAALLVQGALALWRGRPFPELDEWPEAIQASQEYDELRALAIEVKAESELALGLHHQVTAMLAAATAEFPHRERLRRLLAVALYRSDRQVEALEQLQSLRTTLEEEFGVEVSSETRTLETDILRQDPALDPPPGVEDSASLPAPPTPTFGREEDIDGVLDALARGARLLTITGPGGIGKTRLAIEAARAALERGTGPADFVDLSDVVDPDLVTARIADQIAPRRPATSDPRTVVKERYRSGGLLVLDNMEQVLGAADDLAALLRSAPELRMIVTSRSPLLLRIERVHPLETLSLIADSRPGDAPAVAMFRNRTDAQRGARSWTAADEAAAREVVALVDGLPLGIELAAARGRMLGPRALATRLRGSLSLLGDGPADLPPRQRSMHRTIQWSVDLLEPEHRRALGRLGVFRAGFDVAATVAVLGSDELSALRIVETLSDASLLRVGHDADGEPRFSMLQVIKSHTPTLLTPVDLDDARGCHAAWVVDLAREAEPLLRSEQAGAWLTRLDRQREDIKAAATWLCRSDHINDAAGLVSSLLRFWLATAGSPEGRDLVEGILSKDSLAPDHRGRLLTLCGRLYERRGDYGTAVELGAQSVAVARKTGDRNAEARACTLLGSSTLWLGRPREAEIHWERSLALMATDDIELRSLTLGNLGLLALDRGDFRRALRIYEAALPHLRELDIADAVTDTLMNLAWAHLGLGQLDSARDVLRQSGRRATGQGGDETVAYHLLGVARLASLTSEHASALRLTQASEVLLASSEQVFEPFERSVCETITAEASAALAAAGDVVTWPTLAREEALALAAQVLGDLTR